MFYSQTFLARKGPLGTVWCAAHLQNRLRKSHYTSTDIVSTVDRIMFPEVPIALRMSGHLLLGVVRIYSMKVEYLVRDCEAAKARLLKAFATVDINLPENGTTARPESVTLPPVLELDALELDDSHLIPEGSPDNHLRSLEDITLPDQIPPSGGRDLYIAITFGDDDDVMTENILHEQDDYANAGPMDEDIIPGDTLNDDMVLKDTGKRIDTEVTNDAGTSNDPGTSHQTKVVSQPLESQDHGASDHTEVLTDTQVLPDSGPSDRTECVDSMLLDEDSPPQFEVLRDAVHATGLGNLPPFMQDQTSNASEPTRPGDSALRDKEILSLIAEDTSPIRKEPGPSNQHANQPNSAASEFADDVFDTNVSFGNTSPGFALRSSPSNQELGIQPSPPAQPPRRGRKRKMFFDESIVFSNDYVKKLLVDTSDVLRRRRTAPSSPLGVWKLRNKLRKEQVLFEPSLTGLSVDICNLFKNDFITAKPHLSLAQDAIPSTVARASSESSNEHIRDTGNTSSPSPIADAMPETEVRTPAPVPEVLQGSRIYASPAPAPDVLQESRIGVSPDPAFKSTAEPAFTATTSANAEPYAEIERLRNIKSPGGMAFLSDVLPSSPRMPSPRNPSPSRTENFTPALSDSPGLETTAHTKRTIGTGVISTPDFGASTSTVNTESGTAGMSFDERFDMDHRLSDIPEMMNDMDAEDLYFLEADCTPPGSQGSQGGDVLSVRTRAVAQYLQKSSPGAPGADGSSSDSLSLDQILEGRKKKLCARMFYEVLVLKSYGLINVHQDEAYGDIKLALTPKISKI